MKTFIKASLTGLLVTLLVSTGVLAAYAAAITVTESSSNSYDMLPVSATMGNSDLVSGYYITGTGLDTRVLSAATPLPHMLASDRTLFALSISADTQYQLTYSTGNAALDNFYIIPGYDGYITVSDAAALELGNNFESEFKGYVDTSSGADKNLVYKEDAFRTYVSATGSITSVFDFDVDAGAAATDRETGLSPGYTSIMLNNPADNDGIINTAEVWAFSSMTGFRVGTFYLVSGTTYKCRDSEVIGNVPTGSKQTFTGLSVSIITGDYIGYYSDTGELEVDMTGGDGIYSVSGEYIDPGDEVSYSLFATRVASLYCTGTPLAVVTATNISSGEHTVKTTADGTNLKIYVDTVEKDSIALSGASVPDNTNDWKLDQTNVMPYMEYYKHTVSSTPIAHYQPNTIIKGEHYTTGTAAFTNDSDQVVGTTTVWTDNMIGSLIKYDADAVWHVVGSVEDGTHLTLTANYSATGGAAAAYTMEVRLPDRQGTAQDGAFTWGSNPAGIAATVGALLPETSSTADVTADAESPSFAPETSDESWFVTGIEGEGFPFYGLFKGLLDSYKDLGGADISMPYFWKIVAGLAGLMFGTFFLLATRSLLIGAASYIIGFVVPATMGVLDWWMVIIYIMGAIPLCILSTKWHAV